MSISKAQAAALADGFLDTLGSNEGIEPKETFTEILLLAGELIESAQANLSSSNSNASGKLSESLTAGDPTLEGNVFSVDILMNYYGLFVNKGVKGTKSGSGYYVFKKEMPSKKHVEAMRAYLKKAGLKTTSPDVKKYGAYGKHERKSVKISELSSAFAIARSIKQHGIKATGFLDKAVQSTSSKVYDRLGAALKIDVINSIIP